MSPKPRVSALRVEHLENPLGLDEQCPRFSWKLIDPRIGGCQTAYRIEVSANGDVGMNSFNHYAYGSIGEWLYSVVAGISELQPGFKRILLCPIPHKNLTRASASFHTPYGLVSSARKRVGKSIEWAVTVPPNTLAVASRPPEKPTPSASAKNIGTTVKEHRRQPRRDRPPSRCLPVDTV